MILWTFQNERVVDIINNNGIHVLTWEQLKLFSPYTHVWQFYKDLSNRLKYNNAPIWTFYTYDGEAIANANEFKKHCYHNNGVLLNLDVPDDFVSLTSYFDWSDYIFYSEELLYRDTEKNRSMKKLSWENTFKINDADRIQALIPYIKKEWVVDIYQ